VGDDYSEGGRDFTCFSQDEFTFFEPMRDFLKISSVVITKDSKKNTEMTEWINFFCLVCK